MWVWESRTEGCELPVPRWSTSTTKNSAGSKKPAHDPEAVRDDSTQERGGVVGLVGAGRTAVDVLVVGDAVAGAAVDEQHGDPPAPPPRPVPQRDAVAEVQQPLLGLLDRAAAAGAAGGARGGGEAAGGAEGGDRRRAAPVHLAARGDSLQVRRCQLLGDGSRLARGPCGAYQNPTFSSKAEG